MSLITKFRLHCVGNDESLSTLEAKIICCPELQLPSSLVANHTHCYFRSVMEIHEALHFQNVPPSTIHSLRRGGARLKMSALVQTSKICDMETLRRNSREGNAWWPQMSSRTTLSSRQQGKHALASPIKISS